jgi:arginyl-tRNA synthetase
MVDTQLCYDYLFIINLRPDESQPLNLSQQRHRDLLQRQYDVELPRVVVDQPPNVGLGEYALPLSFELAKKLRKPPRKIAEESVRIVAQFARNYSFHLSW